MPIPHVEKSGDQNAIYVKGIPQVSRADGWINQDELPSHPRFFEGNLQIDRVGGNHEVYAGVRFLLVHGDVDQHGTWVTSDGQKMRDVIQAYEDDEARVTGTVETGGRLDMVLACRSDNGGLRRLKFFPESYKPGTQSSVLAYSVNGNVAFQLHVNRENSVVTVLLDENFGNLSSFGDTLGPALQKVQARNERISKKGSASSIVFG